MNNDYNYISGKINNFINKGNSQDINVTEEGKGKKENNLINNNNEDEIKDNKFNEGNDLEEEKIIIKFSNNASQTEKNKNEEAINNIDRNKDEIKGKKDEKKENNLDINDKSEFQIENISSIKNNEISLEKIDNNEFDDEENFNVVMSGTILNTYNKKNNSNYNCNKNNNIVKKNIKTKNNEINLINISTNKKPEKISKFNNVPKTPISSNLSKDKKNFINSKINNISVKKNESETHFKSSKKLDFESNIYAIESKDQLSFIVKNASKKKKLVRSVKTPDIQSKIGNRVKSNSKGKNIFLKKNEKNIK
jgi:hypothetical protein